MNPLLSIAIPTHNRFSILEENLRELLGELVETGVEVHVSDSGTDGLTEAGIGALQRIYPGLHYRRAAPGLPYDANCLSALGMPALGMPALGMPALSMPSTEYVWYLGDSIRILPGGVKRVLAALRDTPCDLAAVNLTKRRRADLPAGLHRDPALLLERLAWHLTLAGATIYSRELLSDLETRWARFVGSNFSHLAIILESLPRCRRGLLWLDETWLAGNPRRTSSWLGRTVEVFGRDWAEFILSLEGYGPASKAIAIRSHSLQTGILEWKSLGRLRRKGFLDRELVLRHERHLRLASGVPFPAILFLSQSPRWLASPLAAVGRLGAAVSGVRAG